MEKHRNITAYITAGCLLVAVLVFIWMVKDTVLACHDSMKEFVDARIGGAGKGFEDGVKYGLARGKVGIIFPLVVGFRYMVNGTGNFILIWLLQYIPVFANVALITYLTGKKLGRINGMFWGLMFFSLLQIDIWHNLITCYPLDFMYGLFLMISGLALFDSYLEKKGSKRNFLRVLLSAFLFYESMQVYEAFIVASLSYAVIAFYHAKKGKTGIKGFIISLIPHFITALVYLGILIYLRSHPVVDIAVSNVETSSAALERFPRPYFVYTFGMLPLRDLRVMPPVITFLKHISLKGAAAFAAAGAGSIAALYAEAKRYRNLEKDQRKEENGKLYAVGSVGLLTALTFAIPHSLIPSYQDWVIIGQAGGYVPTTICYFGWSVVIVCLIIRFIRLAASLNKKISEITVPVFAVLLAFSALITVGINLTFRNIVSTTGTWISLKSQTYFAFITDDHVIEKNPDLVYAPSLTGIHMNLNKDESLSEFEMGYDVDLYNDHDKFTKALGDSGDACYFMYDGDAYCGLMIDVGDYKDDVDSWVTDAPIYVVTPHEGEFAIFFMYADDGTRDVRYVSSKPGEGGYFIPDEEILINSIDVKRD